MNTGQRTLVPLAYQESSSSISVLNIIEVVSRDKFREYIKVKLRMMKAGFTFMST